ncbi:MAG: hypothetical protein AAFQ22_04520 [Pseudomonadota bacterium]
MIRRVHPIITYRNDMDLLLLAWAARNGPASKTEPPTPPWHVRELARQTGQPAHRARLLAGFIGIELEDA